MAIKFRAAKHCDWILRIAEWGNALDLFWHNRLHLDPADLKTLQSIPKGCGLIIAVNHADEMDIRLCMELSRRSKRCFTYMVNSEAFEEGYGLAGWWLQRLGCFSVERGGKDQEAIRYAIEVVKEGRHALVIFPEGEIYYVNDLVQPFKTGAVHIGLQALLEARKRVADWEVYLLPLAIKYRYPETIASMLNKRIKRMERHLQLRSHYLTFQERLIAIMAKLSKQEPHFDAAQENREQQLKRLQDRLDEIRLEILSRIESHYGQASHRQRDRLVDRAYKIIFYLREKLKQKKIFDSETRKKLKEDLHEIKRVIQMKGWQPHYIELEPSGERLAETVMNLEREVFNKKRPRPLGRRRVFMRMGTPLALGSYLSAYQKDPSFVSHQIAQTLQENVQRLINQIAFEDLRGKRSSQGHD